MENGRQVQEDRSQSITNTTASDAGDVAPPCRGRHLSPLGAAWASPNTLVGLLFALASGALPRPRHGLLVAQSNRGLARLFLSRRGFGAITFGRVVISAVPLTPALLRHEAHHVWQYERLGILFIPVYLWHQARRGYHHNPLEHEAEACARHA